MKMPKMPYPRLINLNPDKTPGMKMAELFRGGNQKDSALSYYSHAYQLSPNDYRNGTGLADILIDKKNFSMQIVLLIRVIQDFLKHPILKLRIRSAYEAKELSKCALARRELMRLDEPS